MNGSGRIIATGSYLYDGTVRCLVEIKERIGAAIDAPNPEQRSVGLGGSHFQLCYRSATTGKIASEVGPFESVVEARRHADEVTSGIEWSEPA